MRSGREVFAIIIGVIGAGEVASQGPRSDRQSSLASHGQYAVGSLPGSRAPTLVPTLPLTPLPPVELMLNKRALPGSGTSAPNVAFWFWLSPSFMRYDQAQELPGSLG